MRLEKNKIKKMWSLIEIIIGVIFIVMSIFAKKKKSDSLYKDEPKQKNPFEGKKVVFIADPEGKENADGERGYLE